MTTAVEICNSALLLVGANTITAFDDVTDEAQLADSVYETTKEALLQKHPWRFSILLADLGGKVTTDPLFGFKNQYTLPSDMLRIIRLEGAGYAYKIYKNLLHTDVEPPCRIVYQQKTPETQFPAYFRRVLELELAILFAMALPEDDNRVARVEMLAEKQLRTARAVDDQQEPNEGLMDVNYSLVNLRG